MDGMPEGLASGGRALWSAIAGEHELDAAQLVQLTEACRAKDRCDAMALALEELDVEQWGKLADQANAAANLMKQLLAALRLPDESGKRPQRRGGARGSYRPKSSGTTAAEKAASRWGA